MAKLEQTLNFEGTLNDLDFENSQLKMEILKLRKENQKLIKENQNLIKKNKSTIDDSNVFMDRIIELEKENELLFNKELHYSMVKKFIGDNLDGSIASIGKFVLGNQIMNRWKFWFNLPTNYKRYRRFAEAGLVTWTTIFMDIDKILKEQHPPRGMQARFISADMMKDDDSFNAYICQDNGFRDIENCRLVNKKLIGSLNHAVGTILGS